MSQNLRAGPSCVSRQENVVDGQKLSRGHENRPEMLKASLTHIAGVAADQIFQEVAQSAGYSGPWLSATKFLLAEFFDNMRLDCVPAAVRRSILIYEKWGQPILRPDKIPGRALAAAPVETHCWGSAPWLREHGRP